MLQDEQNNLSICSGNYPSSKTVAVLDTKGLIGNIDDFRQKFFSGELFFRSSDFSVLLNANRFANLKDFLTQGLGLKQYNIPQMMPQAQKKPMSKKVNTQTNINHHIANIANNNQNQVGTLHSNNSNGTVNYSQGHSPVIVLKNDNDLAKRLKYSLEMEGFKFAEHPEFLIQSLSDNSINIFNGYNYIRITEKDIKEQHNNGIAKSLIQYIKKNNIDMFKKMSKDYPGGRHYNYSPCQANNFAIKGDKNKGNDCCIIY